MNYLSSIHNMLKLSIHLLGKMRTQPLRPLLGLLLLTSSLTSSAQMTMTQPYIGIIVPTHYETHYLQQAIQQPKTLRIDGVTYTTGTLQHKNIVLAISGLGKVNTAAITSRLIKDFHPELIFLSGSAGSIDTNLQTGDVIVGKSVIDVDLGQYTTKGVLFLDHQYLMSLQTNRPLPLEFKLNDHLISWIKDLPKPTGYSIKLGTIATSDSLPNPEQQLDLLKKNKVDVVEMEGAAIMHTCWLFNTSCIIVRGVSNPAKHAITSDGINTAADNSAKVVIDLIGQYPIPSKPIVAKSDSL